MQLPSPAASAKPRASSPAAPKWINKPIPLEEYCEVGDVILWFPSPAIGIQPVPALVTSIGLGAVDANVIHNGVCDTMPVNGCHHLKKQADKIDDAGGWLPRPIDVAVRRSLLGHNAIIWNPETSRYVVAYSCPPMKPSEVKTEDPPVGDAAGAAAGTLSAIA